MDGLEEWFRNATVEQLEIILSNIQHVDDAQNIVFFVRKMIDSEEQLPIFEAQN